MNPALDSVDLKLGRSYEQFKALFREVYTALRDPEAYRVERQVNPDLMRVYAVFRELKRLPPLWGVQIGEMAHNLHSILDYLVRQLFILENGGPSQSTQLQFPVFLTEAGYKTRGAPKVAGLSEKARTLIESLQPFATKEGADSPLWHLYCLSIWDKHKDLPLTRVAFTANANRSAQAVVGEVIGVGIVAPGTVLKDNTALGFVTLRPSETPFLERAGAVQMKVEFGMTVAFEQPESLA